MAEVEPLGLSLAFCASIYEFSWTLCEQAWVLKGDLTLHF